MKFTKEEAFENLKGLLTNNGKKSLRMSEKSIEKQLETLIPLLANDETELNDFVDKVKDTFSVMNSNMEKDSSDFVKKWEKEHPDPKKNDGGSGNTGDGDATAALLKRIEDLEKKDAERQREAAITQKKSDLLAAMKKKGIKDEQWAKDFISEISVTDDFDIEAKAADYLKLYNKSQAGEGSSTTPLGSSSTGGDPNRKDPLAATRNLIKQRRESAEALSRQLKKE